MAKVLVTAEVVDLVTRKGPFKISEGLFCAHWQMDGVILTDRSEVGCVGTISHHKLM